MEHVFEHLLGTEFFEKDDVVVDMRELARLRERPALSVVPTPGATPAADSGRKTG